MSEFQLLTPTEVAERFQRTASRVRQLVRAGLIPATRAGTKPTRKYIKIRLTDVDPALFPPRREKR